MDPNSLNDIFSNPDAMNEMKTMMNDPKIMEQMNHMMSNPDMLNNIMNMMGGLGNQSSNNNDDNFDNEQEYQDKVGELDLNELNDLEKVDIGQPHRETLFIENDYVLIINLKNKKYNNKLGRVINYEKITNRYIVYLEELDKHLSIKECNLKMIYDAEQDIEEDSSDNSSTDDNVCSYSYIEPEEDTCTKNVDSECQHN